MGERPASGSFVPLGSSAGGVTAAPAPSAAAVASTAAQGPAGPPGRDLPSAANVAATVIRAGQPVFIDRSTGQMDLAQADVYVRRACVGLARADVASGFVGQAESKVLTLADWTAVTGTAGLAEGQTYFLTTTPGQLSLQPPTAPGCSVVRVGIATGMQMLAIIHAPPILL